MTIKSQTSILYSQASQYDGYVFELNHYFWQLLDKDIRIISDIISLGHYKRCPLLIKSAQR